MRLIKSRKINHYFRFVYDSLSGHVFVADDDGNTLRRASVEELLLALLEKKT